SLAQLAADVEPALSRKHDVQDQEIDEARSGMRECPFAVADRLDVVTLGSQPIRKRGHEARLVFHQQNPARDPFGRRLVRFHEAGASSPPPFCAVGIRIVKRAPPPSLDSTVTLPPWLSTIGRTSASPSPLPAMPSDGEDSPR